MRKIVDKKLIVGNKYRLDKDYANSSIVTLVYLTSSGLFAQVTSDGKHTWDVMANRLSEIEKI